MTEHRNNGPVFLIKLFVTILCILTNPEKVIGQNALDFLNRTLNGTETALEKNTARLSGGRYRLPDDPANQALYEVLESHIRQWEREIGNSEDMGSYFQTAEGYLGQLTTVLQRIKDLCLKRGNPIYSEFDREIIDREIDQQYEQIRFTLNNAQFNKKNIFAELLADPLLSHRFKDPAYYQADKVERLLSFVLYQRSLYGARMSSLSSQIRSKALQRENTSQLQSVAGDVRVAEELSQMKSNHLLFLVNLLQLDLSD